MSRRGILRQGVKRTEHTSYLCQFIIALVRLLGPLLNLSAI